jgi:hypothetical protein
MASIKQTCLKILQSKEWESANEDDKVKILITLCFCIFDQTRINMVKRYGKIKWFNSCHIKSELNSISPPDVNFDIR